MQQSVHRSFFIDFFIQAYAYREFLKQSVLRDLRNKYKRSVLGYIWTMLHPLAMMAVLALVFSQIMKVENYAVFLFTGLIPWNYFNSTALMSLNSIKANSRLFGQVPVPKYIFILSLVCSNLANLVFAIVPLVILMLIYGNKISAVVLATPVIILPLIFIVTAFSLLLAASNVFFDDTLHLAEVGMQALYFLSPVLYMRSALTPELAKYLSFNPLTFPIESFRGLFYYATLPDPLIFTGNLAFSLLFLWAALRIFERAQDRFLYFV